MKLSAFLILVDAADRQNVVVEFADSGLSTDSISQGAQSGILRQVHVRVDYKACSGCLNSEMERGYCGCIRNGKSVLSELRVQSLVGIY